MISNKHIRLYSSNTNLIYALVFGICMFLVITYYSLSSTKYVRRDPISKKRIEEPTISVDDVPLPLVVDEISENIPEVVTQSEYCPSIPPNLKGEFDVDFKEEPLDVVDQRLSFALKPGGWYTPKECKPRDRVAIVVPMKDRMYHLPKFLRNIHPMLMRQQIEYAIYIVEQIGDQPFFNKGALFNAGYVESLKMYNWDCFIFHDIDMIPINDNHLYKCPTNGPLHMGVSLDKLNWKLLYDEMFGGVVGFTTADYKRINGFSNRFWGWGGEDNDLRNRVLQAQLPLSRSPINVARYRSLPHEFSKMNPQWKKQIVDGNKYYNTSGLNSVEYHLKEIKIRPSFVHIIVDHIKEELPLPSLNASNKNISAGFSKKDVFVLQ